jgi:hypothetical protein
MTPWFFKSFILVNIFIILTNLFETFILFFRKTSVITKATLTPSYKLFPMYSIIWSQELQFSYKGIPAQNTISVIIKYYSRAIRIGSDFKTWPSQIILVKGVCHTQWQCQFMAAFILNLRLNTNADCHMEMVIM